MTENDLFVRRESTTPVKGRVVLLSLLLLVTAGAAVFLSHRAHRSAGPENAAIASPAVPPPVSLPPATAQAVSAVEPLPPPVAAPPTTPVPDPPAPPSATATNATSPVATSDQADLTALPLFTEARTLADQGQWGTAREKALAALAANPGPALRRQIEDALAPIHSELVFSPAPMAEKMDYTIQPGDSLKTIAKKFGTTVDLIQKSNHLPTPVIRPGDRLRVLQGTFKVIVDVSDHELTVFLNDRFFLRYAVGTGKYEKTPSGDFKITERISHPTWWRADGKAIPYGDKENVLGTHWLALDVKGYGLHGTWEPETIGKSESAGCVRMLNKNVEELFVLLPTGTPVTIQP